MMTLLRVAALVIQAFPGVLLIDGLEQPGWAPGTYRMDAFADCLYQVDKDHKLAVVKHLPPGTIITEAPTIRMEQNSPKPEPTWWTVQADGISARGIPARNGIWYGGPNGDGEPFLTTITFACRTRAEWAVWEKAERAAGRIK